MRYALYMPFSFDAQDDQTAALVANLLAHRNALLLDEGGRVVATREAPPPAELLSLDDLRERGEAVAAALDTVACGHTGERPELDRMVDEALRHPDALRGPWSRGAVVRGVYRRWFLRHDNQVTALVYSHVEHLASRVRELLGVMTQVIRG